MKLQEILYPVLVVARTAEWKFTKKELKVHSTKEQAMLNPQLPGQFLNTFIGEKRENQNKIGVQLSSSCQTEYRNAHKTEC